MRFCSGILLIAIQINLLTGENILFYFGVTGFSHVSSIWPLVQTLAENGHNVTVFTPFPTKQRVKLGVHINEIVSEELLKLFSSKWDADADLIRQRMNGNQDSFWHLLPSTAVEACEIVLTSPQTSSLVHNSKFDLVILDIAFNECGVALARYKYNAPFIAWAATSFNAYVYDQFGLPPETSAVTDLESTYVGPLSLYEKLQAVLIPLKWTLIRQYYYYHPLEKLVQVKLELPERPSFTHLNRETSMFLMNTYHTTHHARSAPPFLVQVGGMHISEERHPLPVEIDNFLSNSKSVPGYQGFVYTSFGTLVRFSKCDERIRVKFFNALGNMTSLKFLWKWDEHEVPTNGPANVYFTNAWLPQQDIYAHPDIIGVMGHGGINGMHEAVYFGIPMIVFPIVADQDFNGNTVVSKGYGIKLEITRFTQGDLQNALHELVINPSYKSNAQIASKLFKDRPMTPVQTALWWTEYVLRHRNTSSLMPLTRHQSWYEKRLLDVWLVIFLAVQLAIWIVAMIILKTYKVLNGSYWKAGTNDRRSHRISKKEQ